MTPTSHWILEEEVNFLVNTPPINLIAHVAINGNNNLFVTTIISHLDVIHMANVYNKNTLK